MIRRERGVDRYLYNQVGTGDQNVPNSTRKVDLRSAQGRILHPRNLIIDKSMIDESMNDESMNDESMNDESMNDESMNDESMNDESMNDESMNDESMIDESLNFSNTTTTRRNRNSITART
ncbi:hypothetical protein CLCR_02677 [Cladophialophora carrionii]|uniref:Uncharacterized protein n=1 Tax=Cladophialophora carrionii TaxID=86049 RepID=A0A1C1CET7_9EURO|nr:hypothetical protein CLCR_02677 [Cladophialophora carrionii]